MHHTEFLARRQALKLTHVELAERLGVHHNTVARWERGEVPIERPRMVRVMLDVIEEDLRQEPQEVRQARAERWWRRHKEAL